MCRPNQIINCLSTKIELLSPISFSLHGLNLVLPIISGLSYDPCSPLTKLSELYKKNPLFTQNGLPEPKAHNAG